MEKRKRILHTVNKSPHETSSLESCLRFARPGSSVLLIEDGVYAAKRGASTELWICKAMRYCSVFVLEPDLRARGLSHEEIIDGVDPVGYDGFVDLAITHGVVKSWL